MDNKYSAAILEEFYATGQIDPDGILIKEFLVHCQRSHFIPSATWHPLGFMNVVVGTDEESVVRLHVWTPESLSHITINWPIHDHIWTLHSRVLLGDITNRKYITAGDIISPTHRVYHVVHGDSEAVLVPGDDIVRCRLDSATAYSAGVQYSLPAHEFHSSEVLLSKWEMVATCIVSGISRRGTPRVLGTVEPQHGLRDKRVACPPEAICNTCVRLLDRIK